MNRKELLFRPKQNLTACRDQASGPGEQAQIGRGKTMQEAPLNGERIIEIEIERLKDFKKNPFKIREDTELEQLMSSVERYGVLCPLIVRPTLDATYEIISGHRRKYVAALLGYRKLPVIIRHMNDEEAVIVLVESNLKWRTVKCSEKAFAIRMKYDVLKWNGRSAKEKMDLDYSNTSGVRTIQLIGKEIGESPKQIQRFVKITELLPEFLEMLDKGEISFNPAFEVAFLKKEEQRELLDAMEYTQSTPSLSQAQRFHRLSKEGEFTREAAREILGEVKKGDIRRVNFKNDQLHLFFPKEFTPERMKAEILELLTERMEKEKKGKPKGQETISTDELFKPKEETKNV